MLKKLPADLKPERLPKHIAVIMDGNGRWAKHKGFPRIVGHRRGADVLKDILRCCNDWGIPAFTAYAFSTENWGRPQPEVDFLMSLFEGVLRAELQELIDEKMQIRFMGNLHQLPPSLQRQIERSVKETRGNPGLKLTLAMNYGGRQEIIDACRAIAGKVQKGIIQPEDIDQQMFQQYLYTADVGDPDLLIRTSGEMRVSNFLLWQIAYSEIYITDTHWPDFDRTELYRALSNYQTRERRFGKI